MRQGHQNEFRTTLEDKLLEKIVLIWTPAKTMKKTPQTSQKEEATKRPPQKPQKSPGSGARGTQATARKLPARDPLDKNNA